MEEVCRKVGISQATFYAWKKKYAGLGVSELRRLKQLVADLSLTRYLTLLLSFITGSIGLWKVQRSFDALRR